MQTTRQNKATVSLVLSATLACMGMASAQQAPSAVVGTPTQTPALTSEQQAQLARQDAEVTRAAGQVMQWVDAGRIGEVWDGASDAIKRVVSREAFVSGIAADRARLGAVSGRARPVVTRARMPAGAEVPEGLYLSVAMATTFVGQPQPIRELVSFRLDEDRTLRVSGYTLRAAEPSAGAAPASPASPPASKP